MYRSYITDGVLKPLVQKRKTIYPLADDVFNKLGFISYELSSAKFDRPDVENNSLLIDNTTLIFTTPGWYDIKFYAKVENPVSAVVELICKTSAGIIRHLHRFNALSDIFVVATSYQFNSGDRLFVYTKSNIYPATSHMSTSGALIIIRMC